MARKPPDLAVIKTAKRNVRVQVQRADISLDHLGGETKTWTTIAQPWAAMYYGRGEERRQAAAKQGQQVVTANVLASPLTRSIRITDRLLVGAEVLDIVATSPIGRLEIDLTAVRAP